jgi:membrane associated rhomboid family serine protease/Flp pilus assembly protein TadD
MAKCIQCGRQLPPLTFGKKICQWCVQHEAAQRGEEDDNAVQRVMPAPWTRGGVSNISLTHIIFGANVAVFVAMVYAGGSTDFNGQLKVDFGANYGPYTLSGQWWRLLTYNFLHSGIFHIAMNMWCLWNLGALCESLYGRWTYAAVYLITGVAGGLTSVAWTPGVLSVGASGAIFGLTGALIASFYLGEFSLSGISIKGTLSSLLFFAGFSLFLGKVVPGIDNGAHIGGLVSGLILGALIARVAPEQDRPLRRAGVLLFMVVILAGSAVGVQRWRGSQVGYPQFAEAQRSIDQIISDLQKKVQSNPQDASAHATLARAYINKGQYSDGETELKRVLELQPQNTQARRYLGAVFLNQKQPAQAKAEFAAWVSQEPNNADAHVWLGMALAAEQNSEDAIKEYNTALKLDPQVEGVYYQIGTSQAQLKQYDDAIASYVKQRETSGDDSDLEVALADAYQAKGMTREAEEARTRAAQLRSRETD